MSEQLQTPVEYQLGASLEPVAQAYERISTELNVVPALEADSTISEEHQFGFIGRKMTSGEYHWYPMYAEPKEGEFVEVNVQEHPEDAPVFEMAESEFRNHPSVRNHIARQEGRWWLSTAVENEVENNLKEGFRLHDGERHIDVLNTYHELMTDVEKQSIINAFQAVDKFTDGKIFDRVAGIVIVPQSAMKDGVAGSYQPATGVIHVSMEELRLNNPESLGRYKQFFEGQDVTWPELIMSHELGHAMDINLIEEADAHGLDKDSFYWMGMGNRTSSFSAFDDKHGWEHHIQADQKPDSTYVEHQTVRKLNDAILVEEREDPPTGYATVSPREDFAETFSIASLGGNTTRMSRRGETVKKTVGLALGNSSPEAHTVKVEDIVSINQLIKPIDKVSLRVLVAA